MTSSCCSVKDIDQKIKFENMLQKKCKELEKLGNALVLREKEVLVKLKNK